MKFVKVFFGYFLFQKKVIFIFEIKHHADKGNRVIR